MFKKIKTLVFHRGWTVKLPSAASSYTFLIGRLYADQPFAFSRWGDGEWEAALNLRGESEANCDGHQYFHSLRECLKRILVSNPPYFTGMQKLAYHKVCGREIDRFLKSNRIRREWLNADAFHYASTAGKIESFFDILSEKKVLLVGPAHLRKLELFDFDFCEVPEKNCWLEKDRILQQIQAVLQSRDIEVILFCAGMTSNWFVDELSTTFKGFIIDVGSLLDPYAGIHSRTYHKKLSLAGLSGRSKSNADI